MDIIGKGFTYLKNKFPRVSDAKIKKGIFVGLLQGADEIPKC